MVRPPATGSSMQADSCLRGATWVDIAQQPNALAVQNGIALSAMTAVCLSCMSYPNNRSLAGTAGMSSAKPHGVNPLSRRDYATS